MTSLLLKVLLQVTKWFLLYPLKFSIQNGLETKTKRGQDEDAETALS